MAIAIAGSFLAITATSNLTIAQTKSSAPTADQAKNNVNDRDIMQKIRQGVMADKSLSTYAHNVKIISQNGKVTLKGPVRSDDEKQAVEKIATDVAGAGNVTNEITVKPAKSNKKS
jgi:osmotically-inducible protein OsmY